MFYLARQGFQQNRFAVNKTAQFIQQLHREKRNKSRSQIERMKRAPKRITPKRDDERNSNNRTEHAYEVHGTGLGAGVSSTYSQGYGDMVAFSNKGVRIEDQ